MRIVVIGAGVMGLACAFDLLGDGHEVTVLEGAPVTGGLAGSFDFGGVRVEKFYHFICGQDQVYFRWLRRLGLGERLRWRRTAMGFYYGGQLHRFGDPVSLLRFPPLSLKDRLRYGFHVWSAKRLKDWTPLENVRARDWLLEGEGEEPYRIIWEPLLKDKFREQTDTISAAWIWSRIHRLASSRDGLYRERLGYVEGGSQVIVDALTRGVVERGGDLRLETPVEKIRIEDGLARFVQAAGNEIPADAVVSTAPLPILIRLADSFPGSYVQEAKRIDNIGVRCIILKLRRPLSSYFWINANGDDVPICGLVEYTNLNPAENFGGFSLVYSPHYAPSSHPEYRRADGDVLAETIESISRVVPGFDPGTVVDHRVFRAPYAQPVCPAGFSSLLAPIVTSAPNLIAADTSHLLPHDRSISDSLALSERLTDAVRKRLAWSNGHNRTPSPEG